MHGPIFSRGLSRLCPKNFSTAPEKNCYANLQNYSAQLTEIIAGMYKTLGSPWIRRSRSPKGDDFGANRKRVYDFLLVRNSNLGPILHRFGDIAVFCAPE